MPRCSAHRTALLAASLIAASAAPAAAAPIAPGQAVFKTHPTVPEGPKYRIPLPEYFTPDNLLASHATAVGGGLSGVVSTSVYRDPATARLAFHYTVTADLHNQAPIVRATIGGTWRGVEISDSGAHGNGIGGSADPAPEWTDGDPLFLNRDPFTHAPAIQWRLTALGAGIGAGDISADFWFQTDATAYAQVPAVFHDTALFGISTVLAPVPAPAAGATIAGLALALAVRRRR